MRLNAIGILCADLEASLGFYRALGVAFPDYDPDQGHYSADLGGGFRLMLDSHAVAASFIEGFAPPQGNDVLTLAVEFDSPAGVDAAHTAITAMGHASRREPFDAFWGQRYATVADPDGNQIDLYAASAG
ncbi:MAG: VOC family protein [Acidimicrobiia bacterium]|nr:VOC family protein [Acidimicrobiia bacterium]